MLLLALAAWWLSAAPAHAEEGSEPPPATVEGAWAALEEGALERALAESEAVVRREDASAYAWTIRGWILSRAARKVEAAEAYRRAALLDPQDALVQNNLGAVLLDLGRADEAVVVLRRALSLDPDYADARNNLGAALERQGEVEAARAAYRQAVEADPLHATAHNNRGALALRQGRLDEAREALQRARDLDPGFGAPPLNLLLLGGRDFAVSALFDSLQQAAKDEDAPPRVRARALAALAGRAAQRGRFEEARAWLLEAVRLQPDEPNFLNNLAVVEDQLGLDREAMLHLEAVLRLRPDSLVARNNIGIVHVHRGSFELARDVFRAILEDDPNFHRAHYNLGVVHAAEQRLAEAEASFTRAAALAPEDASVLYNLAIVRRQRGGSAAQEITDYRRALQLDPDLGEAHLSLGCVLADPQTQRDLRDETAARRHLQRFLQLARPTDQEGRAEAEAWLAWLDRPRR